MIVTSEIFNLFQGLFDKEISFFHVSWIYGKTEAVEWVVAGIHLEWDTLIVVILFYPNSQIFTIFTLNDCESLFVIAGDSVGQLFTIVLCYFIVVRIKLRPNHVTSIVVNSHCTFHVGVTRN